MFTIQRSEACHARRRHGAPSSRPRSRSRPSRSRRPFSSWRGFMACIPARCSNGRSNCSPARRVCSRRSIACRKPWHSRRANPSCSSRSAGSTWSSTGSKKKLPASVEARRAPIDADPAVSIRRQCELLDLPRSTYYYLPATETAENLHLLRLLDEQYLRTPFYGSRRMAVWLCPEGYRVNRKRVQRLMRVLGLEGLAPRPRTTKPAPGHRVFPYLLRNVEITHADHVWSTDITYIPLRNGYLYLAAIMDWYSRYVLSWRLSN